MTRVPVASRHPSDVRLSQVPGLPQAVAGLLASRGLLWVSDAVEAIEADPLFGTFRHAHVLWCWSDCRLMYTVCLDAEAALQAAYEGPKGGGQ